MTDAWIRILCCLLSTGATGLGATAATAARHGAVVRCGRPAHKRHHRCVHGRSRHRSAPVLRVSGHTLTWTRVHGFSRYQLKAKRDHTVGRALLRVVTGTRFTPRSKPGQTITYRVRAKVPHSAWSRAVTVTWPPSHTVATTRPPSNTVATRPPSNTAATTRPRLRVAVNNIWGANADPLFRQIGVTWERLDIGTGSGLRYVQAAVSDGMHVLPVFTAGDGGSLEGLTPAQVASDITSLVPQLTRLGVRTLEFGNEVYRFMDARSYAALYDAAHRAAAGRMILLAPGTTDYYEHARGGKGNWFSDLAAALPGGPSEVDALTLHPYGSMTNTCGDGYGWPMLSGLHAESVRAGFSASLPWYITEVGQEISGGSLECQAPVSEAEQAADVTRYLTDVVTEDPWVTFLSFYTVRDDPGDGFGLLNSDNSPRPAFLALKAWMAANAARVDG